MYSSLKHHLISNLFCHGLFITQIGKLYKLLGKEKKITNQQIFG